MTQVLSEAGSVKREENPRIRRDCQRTARGFGFFSEFNPALLLPAIKNCGIMAVKNAQGMEDTKKR